MRGGFTLDYPHFVTILQAKARHIRQDGRKTFCAMAHRHDAVSGHGTAPDRWGLWPDTTGLGPTPQRMSSIACRLSGTCGVISA